MNDIEFKSIINFAIEKENEAITFYSDLIKTTKLPFVIEILTDIINMEKGHISRLNNLLSVGIDHNTTKSITPLNLSDYQDEPLNTTQLDYPALLLIAMKREENAKNLYTGLANHFSDLEIRNVFITLAEEEKTHKEHFNKIYEDNLLINN